jgi:hypothetical protein
VVFGGGISYKTFVEGVGGGILLLPGRGRDEEGWYMNYVRGQLLIGGAQRNDGTAYTSLGVIHYGRASGVCVNHFVAKREGER